MRMTKLLKKSLSLLCVALSLLLPLEAVCDVAAPMAFTARAEEAQGEMSPAEDSAQDVPAPASSVEQSMPVDAPIGEEPSVPEIASAGDVPSAESALEDSSVEVSSPSDDEAPALPEDAASESGSPSEGADISDAAPSETPLPEFCVRDGVLTAYNGDKEKLVVPDDLGIEEIGPRAFAHNEKLRSVALPDDVTVIAESAFEGCTALERVVLPLKLHAVGDNAFAGCPKLVAVVRPDSPAQRYCEFANIPYEVEGEAQSVPEHEVIEPQADNAAVEPETKTETTEPQADSAETEVAPEVTPEAAEPHVDSTEAETTPEITEPTTDSAETGIEGSVPDGDATDAPSDDVASAPVGDVQASVDAAFSPFASVLGAVDGAANPDDTLLESEPAEIANDAEDALPAAEETETPSQSSITFENGDLTIGKGETVSGALVPVLAQGAVGAITYESSAPDVATVDENGKLRGVAPGDATITASLEDGSQASCTVTVCKAPTSVKLRADSKTLGKGESTGIYADFNEGAYSYALTLKSSNTKVARIEDGEVVAVSKGMSIITVKAFNGKSGTLTITVKAAPSSVSFTSDASPLCVGMSRTLGAKLNSNAAGAIHYEIISGSDCASLEGNVLTATAEGSVTVGAYAYNDKSDAQTITILPAPTHLQLSAEAVELCVGQTVKQPVEVIPDSEVALSYSYASSNQGVVTVSEAGAITGVATGSADITVSTYNGASASYRVDVFKAPSSIQVSARTTIGVGETITPVVTTTTDGAIVGAYTLSSNNAKIVQVKGDSLYAKSKGTVTITVKSFNGKKSTFKLTVKAAPKGLKFTSSDLPLAVGMEQELQATSSNSGAAGEITYSIVSGEEFATLEGNLLRAVAEGDVTVRASTYGDIYVDQSLRICSAPTMLNISDERIECGVGQKVATPVTIEQNSDARPSYTYESSDEDVVTVDGSGALNCKKVGSATITVTSFNDLTASYDVEVFAAPASIKLEADVTTVGVGEVITPIVTTPTEGARVGSYTLTSSSAKVIQVEGNSLYAKSKGSATITAKSYNGKKATLKFTVKAAPKDIEFTSSPDAMGVGMTRELVAAFTNSGAGGTIQYAIVDGEEFATLNGSILTATAPGEVTVTASTYGDLSAYQTLQIYPAPTSLTLSESAAEISVGQTVKQPVEVFCDGEFAFPCTYVSSDTKIVTVNSTGAITGKKAGSATITVTTYNGLSENYGVTVYAAPVIVKIKLPSTLGVGEVATPEVSTTTAGAKILDYTLSSSNSKVVEVDGTSIIAASKGSATITVKSFNGKKATAKVTVKPEPEGMEFTNSPDPLSVGMTLNLAAKFTNSSAAGEILYEISRGEEFATLDGTTLTARAPGDVTVTASTYNGVSASQMITICPAPTQLTVSEREVELIVGQTIADPVSVLSDSGAKPSLSYASSDTAIATVSAAGAITGKKAGSARIIVTSYNGTVASYGVTVYAAPQSIKIEAPATIGLDETITPTITTTTAGAKVGSYTLSSSNKKIIEVDGAALYANSKGTATITAKSFNGKKATLKITVKSAPTGLQFTSSSAALGVGLTRTLSATCTNSGAAVGEIRYEIESGAEYATLEGNLLTAIAPGEVTVRASTYSGASDVQTISISSVEQSVQLCVGQSAPFPQEPAEGVTYSYLSSDPDVAAVDDAGTISAKAAGSACVTATAGDGTAIVCGVSVSAAPSKVQIASIPALGVGETFTPVVTGGSNGAPVGSYTLSTSNKNIFAVEGLSIRAVAKGSATLTAKSFNGKKATLKVTVKVAPTGLQFTSSADPLGVGMTLNLAAKFTNSGAAGAIQYAIVAGGECASLEDNVLTANAPGKVTVRASTYTGASATQEIPIFLAPTELAIDRESVDVCVGETLFVPVSVLQNSDAKEAFTYSSTDTSIVTVSTSGAITGKKKGTARIAVSSYSGASASYEVNVCAAPGNVQFKLPSTMGIGETASPAVTTTTADAKVGSYTFSSSNSKVVQAEGQSIRAVAKGTATITVKSFNGKKASHKVTVKVAPTGLRFTSSDNPLGVGMTLNLAATYVNSGAAGAIYYELLSGGECAALEDTVLTANAPGEVTVRASTYTGDPATQTIRILPAPQELHPSPDAVTVCVGQTIAEPVRVSSDSGAMPNFTYVSSDTKIVTVNSAGAITGKKKGTARIAVTAYNGVSTSYGVTVCAAPGSIKISAPSTLGIGETATPEVTTPTAGAQVGSYTLSSSSAKVVAVQGLQVVAVGKGSATITATSFNGKKASRKITVKDAPTGLVFTSSGSPMGIGMRRTLVATYANSGAAGAVQYALVSGGECATLEDGVLVANAEGSVTVTASVYSGQTVSQTIQIFPAPTSIQATDTQQVTLAVGEKHPFSLQVVPANAVAEYTYASSDNTVASVDASGSISALKVGSAQITVTTHNGLSAEIPINVVSYNSVHGTVALAHRGASGYRHENTLEAFTYADTMGAKMFETDVHLTADGQLVLYHDAKLPSGSVIARMTLEQIKAYDSRIPTLEEALSCMSGLSINMFLEFKATGDEVERKAVDAVKRYGMLNRVTFGSFNWSCVQRLHSLAPSVPTVAITKTAADVKKVIASPQNYGYISGISVMYSQLNAAQVRSLHLLGLKVITWTVNTAAEVKREIQMGVDIITTNYPDLVTPYQK